MFDWSLLGLPLLDLPLWAPPVIGGIVGACLGSFTAAAIVRLPAKESLLHPPSSCPHCQKRLQPYDLVPIFSYLWLRGRCRHCGTKLSRHYLVVETLSAMAGGFWLWELGLTPLAFAALAYTLFKIFIVGIYLRRRWQKANPTLQR